MNANPLNTLTVLFLMGCLAVTLAGCGLPNTEVPPGPVSRPAIDAGNFPRLDGSTSAEPIIAKIVCEFLGVECEWMDWPLDNSRRLTPNFSGLIQEFPGYQVTGTHESYLHLIGGEADLIVVARKPSADEWVQAAMNNIELKIEPVALDAFVFIVNDLNPIENLTTEQIRKIYTGKLKDWSEVGGLQAEIHPYQRDANSGSQELMLNLVMRGVPMRNVPQMTLPTMMAPFYAVSQDVQGLGYSVFYYEEYLAPAAEQVKLISVDGVMPGPLTITNQEYPYTTEVYAVIRADQAQNVSQQLFTWLSSPEGQELIKEVGYVQRY